MPKLIRRNKIPLLLAFFVFIIYLANLPIDYTKDLKNGLYRRMVPSDDVIPNTFLPYLVVREKTLVFDKIFSTVNFFDDPEHKPNPYFLVKATGGFICAYPIITGIMATPIYFVPLLLNKIPEVTYHENIIKIAALGRVAAAFYATISVFLFYKTGELVSSDKKKLALFTIFYALGTNTYTVSSRGLWMHTTAQVFFSLILYLLLLAETKGKNYFTLIGLLTGLSVVNRPTAIVIAFMVFGYVVLFKRKQLIPFLLGATPTVIFLAIYNWANFGSPFIEGYAARGAANDWGANPLIGMAGYFISPARGFLFISPPLLLAFVGMYQKIKAQDRLQTMLALGVLGSMIMMARWDTWDGANAFGCRMLTEYLPFFGLFAYTVFIKLPKKLILLMLVLFIYSFYVHFNAVFNRKSRCEGNDNWNFYCLKFPTKKAQY